MNIGLKNSDSETIVIFPNSESFDESSEKVKKGIIRKTITIFDEMLKGKFSEVSSTLFSVKIHIFPKIEEIKKKIETKSIKEFVKKSNKKKIELSRSHIASKSSDQEKMKTDNLNKLDLNH